MGRHSAPDDDDTASGVATTAVDDTIADVEPRGRHHAAEPDAETAAETDAEGTAEPAQPEPTTAGPVTEQPRSERGSQADLRLLRERPAVRAQCLGAVLAPFVVYTVVLFVIDKVDDYVLWLWAPIIAAGVLVGAVLDAAHKRVNRPTDARTDEARDERPDDP